VPVLFNPLLLKNHAGTCGFISPDWLLAAAREDKSTLRRLEAQAILRLTDAEQRPWLHLVDGGVSDNLGLRSLYSTMKLVGDANTAFREFGHPGVSQILLISVNSHVGSIPDWAHAKAAPGIAQVISSMASSQIALYTADTLDAVRFTFEDWAEEASTPEHPVSFHFVEVSFDRAADENQYNKLNNIGTNFNLTDEEVDLLITSAGDILRRSPEFKAFLSTNRN
jgi:NTE family protein